MDLPKLWAQIRADLEQARITLLNDAANDKAISQYEEFLNHNELELACDMLESYAETHAVNKEFYKRKSQEKKFPGDWKEQRFLPGSPAHVM